MQIIRLRPWMLAAVAALALGGAVPHTVSASNSGYMVFDSFTESYEKSGGIVTITGTISNECSAPIKPGSSLVFEFDNVPFTGFQITATAYGQQQDFSVYGTLPSDLKAPKNHVTSLDFVIDLPQDLIRSIGEQKTSPCLVTLQAGTPPL